MEEKAPNLQLQEPASPESLLPSHDFTPVWIALAGLVLLLVLIAVVRALRGKPAFDPATIRRAAYAAAKKQLDAIGHTGVRETAVATSLVIRRFLADSVGDPSLFETHEEFLGRHDSLKKLTPPAREACAGFFGRVARLKYAHDIPSDDPAAVVADARSILETLNGGFLP